MAFLLIHRNDRLKTKDSATVQKSGFTLIEVLVALVIVTVTLTSIYKLQASTLNMTTSGRFYTLAPMLAQSKLAEN